MIDMYQIIAETQFAKPLQHFMHDRKFYAMGKDPNELTSLVLTTVGWYPKWYSVDYSHYDQSIPSWLIRDAFELLFACFNTDDQRNWRWLFDIVVNDFIHKDFISQGGKVVHSDSGVPSGSMFTSMIDTVCNAIMIHTYVNSLQEKSEDKLRYECIICGDDNLICTNFDIDLDHMSSYLLHNFGITMDPNKTVKSEKFQQAPEFLSRIWHSNGAYRPPRVLLAKVCYPERFRDYHANPDLKPEMIIYSYICNYRLGMQELIDVERFLDDFQLEIPKWKKSNVYKYLSGVEAFRLQYATSEQAA
jgi:hypothetical protein